MESKKYETLTEAAKAARALCDGWRFETSDELYSADGLQSIAQIHDEESCTDEDSFYVVSPGGAIGFTEDGERIDWLFIPLNSKEELPTLFETKPAASFCGNCGKPVTPGAHFCGACGAKLN